MTPRSTLLAALIAVMAVVLWIVQRRQRSAVKAERRAMFDACLQLFDSFRLEQDDIYFPVVFARYRGHDIVIEPLADHVLPRKLPVLWLLVTVRGKLPCTGVIDILARPNHAEFYSPFSTLEVAPEPPPGWPEHAAIRSTEPDAARYLERLAGHARLFEDARAKELLISPREVRLVYMADQGSRAAHLMMRQVRFEALRLPADLVAGVLDRTIAIHDDLAKEPIEHPGSQIAS